jgi:hypothetical protein
MADIVKDFSKITNHAPCLFSMVEWRETIVSKSENGFFCVYFLFYIQTALQLKFCLLAGIEN